MKILSICFLCLFALFFSNSCENEKDDLLSNDENWLRLTAGSATWVEDGVCDAIIELQFYLLNDERWVKERVTGGKPLPEGMEPFVNEKDVRVYLYPDTRIDNLQPNEIRFDDYIFDVDMGGILAFPTAATMTIKITIHDSEYIIPYTLKPL